MSMMCEREVLRDGGGGDLCFHVAKDCPTISVIARYSSQQATGNAPSRHIALAL